MTAPEIAALEQSAREFKELLADTYTFCNVASEHELAGFERQFGVRIPDDFRWFVANVANGIVNREPYGFNLLEKVSFSDHFSQTDDYNPALPFMLTEDYDNDRNKHSDYNNGTLTLAGYGCGCVAILVVNGAEWGNVWVDDYASNAEVIPEQLPGKDRLRFHEWVQHEIERTLADELRYMETKREYEAAQQAERERTSIRGRIRRFFSKVLFE